MKTTLIIVFSLLIFGSTIFGQDDDLIDLSGIIMNQNKEPLPYSIIQVKGNLKRSQSDVKGMFSVVAKKNDTIYFYAFGYKRRRIFLPDTLTQKYYYSDIVMIPDTTNIEPVTIYPWRNYEEFKKAFLELQLPEEKTTAYAQKNIDIIKFQALNSVALDPEINSSYVLRQNFNSLSDRMMFPSFGLLDPLKWAKFIQAIRDGSLQNSRDLKPLDENGK